jgi:aldehyde:ferredoxin oxidoreductase
MRDPNPVKYDFSIDTGPMDMALTTHNELLQISGLCLFSNFVPFDAMAAKMLEAVTGWSFDPAARKDTMMRVLNMRHAFNLREGQKPSDCAPPPRSVGEPPHTEGPLAGIRVDHKILARNFFKVMEWDEETGKPSRKLLETLGGMDDVVQDLYG